MASPATEDDDFGQSGPCTTAEIEEAERIKSCFPQLAEVTASELAYVIREIRKWS